MNATNGKICGGSIAFGGGVPLYKGKTRVGGLGVSGDTACADHEIAKRIRHLAQLDPEKGEFADDIIYTPGRRPVAVRASAVREHLAERTETRRRGERHRLLSGRRIALRPIGQGLPTPTVRNRARRRGLAFRN